MKLLLVVAFFCMAGSAEKKRYDGYQVFRLFPSNTQQINAIRSIMHEYDFWKEPRTLNDFADVMVPPEKKAKFLTFLYKNGIESRINNNNVQDLIDNEEDMQKNRNSEMDWTNYHTLEEIHAWLDAIAANYSSNVKVLNLGTSYEGRQVKGLEINFGKNLPTVVIEGGIHAREWVSPASTTWMVNEILRSRLYCTPDSIVRKFNYIFFPVINPDGYAFAWSNERLWRKTRTPYDYGCYGADPNRNFDYHWGEFDGCSNFSCDQTYCGPKAFSEKAIWHYGKFIELIHKSNNIDIYFSFHSYSQAFLYPYGDSYDPAPNKPLFEKMGKAAADALYAVHQKTMQYYQSSSLYLTSGASDDWAYGKFNVTLAGTYEMRDTGEYGFVLPPDQIIPNSEEYFAAVKAMFKVYLNHTGLSY